MNEVACAALELALIKADNLQPIKCVPYLTNDQSSFVFSKLAIKNDEVFGIEF